MDRLCINIACGESYVDGWENFDYAPHTPAVKRANLLARLPIGSGEADVVYSSHFFEHIPRSQTGDFLLECFRILKPGGRVRLVLPDLEEMCRAYLEYRGGDAHMKADFLMLEMLDQCVRTKPGGELGQCYENLRASAEADREMIGFVRHRTGHEIIPASPRRKRTAGGPGRLLERMERMYCKAVLALLPAVFRNQNVSLAMPGERHMWIYDFHTMEGLLQQAGFCEVKRLTATTSDIDDFPFQPLDVTEDGCPRKGAESMYLEAVRP